LRGFGRLTKPRFGLARTETRKLVIEAVIWDFGGVFTTSPFEGFNRYESERGLPKDLIRGLNAANPDDNAWAKLERAEIDAVRFDAMFAEEALALGHQLRGAEVLSALSGKIRPRMVEALRTCKLRFKVGCITNNIADAGRGPGMAADAADEGRMGGLFALFDAVLESSKVGVRKPDPRIYLMMCERLGVEPASCVYLDDLGVNCKPAAELGMKAIKVVTEAQALDDLAQATGLTFPETVPA
jgi:putative hydrolase of the HAD superfamily